MLHSLMCFLALVPSLQTAASHTNHATHPLPSPSSCSACFLLGLPPAHFCLFNPFNLKRLRRENGERWRRERIERKERKWIAAAHSSSCSFPSLCCSSSPSSFTALDLAGGDEEKAQLPETTIILLYLSWKMDSPKFGEISKGGGMCPHLLRARGSEGRRA